MKNKVKLGLVLSTFVALTFISSTQIKANGAYGSGIVLAAIDDEEIHEPIDAGITDLAPQVVTTLVALSGIVSTSILIKKTK